MDILLEFLKWLPRYFFPKICYGCGKEGWIVCPTCRPAVECVLEHPICPTCHHPSPGGFVHPSCQTPGVLDGLTSYYRYQKWAKEIVKQAKFGEHHYFRGLKELSKEFGNELASKGPAFLKKAGPLEDSSQDLRIVPIPLHWWRERKRGFNQATLIARQVAKKLGFPIDQKLLKRTRYTEPQTIVSSSIKLSKEQRAEFENRYPSSLNRKQAIQTFIHKMAAKERLKNIRGAFAMKQADRIPSSVLLIDDVWTTGATMQECCQVLKERGVKSVWGITLLRA